MAEIKRALVKKQLAAVLPNYLSVFDEIKDIRNLTENFKGFNKADYDHFPYKNVISILGERGSGKSTVFVTIRNILRFEKTDGGKTYFLEKFFESQENNNASDRECINNALYEEDINLEIIVPEMLEDSSDILGILLLNIKNYIQKKKEKIDEFYRSKKESYKDHQNFDSCIYSKKSRLEELWDHVFKIYIQRKREFSNILSDNFSGINDYTDDKMESLSSEIKLTEELYKLFTEFVNIFSKGNKNALIFVYFDDVDINPRRCNEVLKTVLRYLKHPNVVVLLSGDIKRFDEDMIIQEMLEDKSYKLEDLLLSGGKRISDGKKELVYEFLKKIMPYSNRYNLVKLSEQEKVNFRYVYENGKECTFSRLINDSFFYDVEEGGNQILPETVYKIFDDKPRGLITVWEYIYKNFKKDVIQPNMVMCKLSEDYEKIGEMVVRYRQLLSIIIETNQKLRQYRELIETDLISILHNGKDKIIIEINLDRFKNLLEINDLSLKQKEDYIVILHLIYFFEKIIRNNSTFKTEENRLGREYSNVLNLIINKNGVFRIYPNGVNPDKILELYSKVSTKLNPDEQANIYENPKYFRIYDEAINTLCTNEELKNFDYEFFQAITEHRSELELDGMHEKDLIIKKRILNEFEDFDFNLSVLEKSGIWELEYPDTNILNISIELNLESLERQVIEIRKAMYFNDTLETIEELNESKRKQFVNIGNSMFYYVKDIKEFIKNYLNVNEANFLERIFENDINSNIKDDIKDDIITRLIYIINLFLNRFKEKYYDRKSSQIEKIAIKRLSTNKIHLVIEQLDYIDDEVLGSRANVKYVKKLYEKYPESISVNNGEMDQNIDPKVSSIYHILSGLWNFFEPEQSRVKAIRVIQNESFPKSTETKIANYISWYQNYLICNQLIIEYENFRITWETYKNTFSNGGKFPKVFDFKELTDELYCRLNEIREYIDKKIHSFTDVYELRKQLKIKIEDTKERYVIDEINIKNLNRIIRKIDDIELKLELKTVMDKIYKNNGIMKEEFDNIIKKVTMYINSIQKNAQNINIYYLEEILSLAEKLINKNVHIQYRSKDDEDIENHAREMLYNFELECIILKFKELLSSQSEDKPV